MRHAIVIAACLLAGCAHNPVPVRVETVEVVKEVQRPCAATVPERPAPIGTLPRDFEALAALLGAKLKEYAAPGGWADKAEAAVLECTTPASQ